MAQPIRFQVFYSDKKLGHEVILLFLTRRQLRYVQ